LFRSSIILLLLIFSFYFNFNKHSLQVSMILNQLLLLLSKLKNQAFHFILVRWEGLTTSELLNFTCIIGNDYFSFVFKFPATLRTLVRSGVWKFKTIHKFMPTMRANYIICNFVVYFFFHVLNLYFIT